MGYLTVNDMIIDIEDPQSLSNYLNEKNLLGSSELPEIKVLSGGVSNKTMLVKHPSGESWVIKQALPQLRVEAEWFSDPRRIHLEALGLRHVSKFIPPHSVPEFVFEDFDQHILIMKAVPEPHSNWKTMLLNGNVKQTHIQFFATLLAQIHSRSFALSELMKKVFHDYYFFESLRLSPYYEYTANQVQLAAEFLQKLCDETRQIRICVVHGDYSPKNMLVYNDQLVLLDYEVIHFGDPAFDVGFSSTHLLSKAHHLENHRNQYQNAARLYWDVYSGEVSKDIVSHNFEKRCVKHTLACLLARVAGKSTLEYLSPIERERQKLVVLELIENLPNTMPWLITDFIDRITKHASH